MIYLQLFISFLQIGAFSFGGGYAAMPLIQNQVVQLHPWLTQSEFTDHFPDDTGTYCRQFRYLRRHPYCRNAGGFGCYCRLCSAILHFSYITGKDLSEIPEFKPSPGRP